MVTTEAIIENYPMYGNKTLGNTTTSLSTLNVTPSVYDLSTPALSVLSNTEITNISVLNTRDECFISEDKKDDNTLHYGIETVFTHTKACKLNPCALNLYQKMLT